MECEGTNVYINHWWVKPVTHEHERMIHWLNTTGVVWDTWIANKAGPNGPSNIKRVLGITFADAEDATAFKLKFGL